MPATFKYIQRTDRANKRGECIIYLRITCNRKKKYYNSGVRILPKYWDKKNERVRRSHRTYNSLNDQLERLLHTAKDSARILRVNNNETAQAIKERIVGASSDNFFDLASQHLQQLQVNKHFYLSKQTKATITKLKSFNGSNMLPLNEVTSQFIQNFIDWLQTTKGNKGSTIKKNMSDIRRVLKLGRKRHLIFFDPFNNVDMPKVKDSKYKPKLSLSQIKDLQSLALPEGDIIWDARNAFILSFYFRVCVLGTCACYVGTTSKTAF